MKHGSRENQFSISLSILRKGRAVGRNRAVKGDFQNASTKGIVVKYSVKGSIASRTFTAKRALEQGSTRFNMTMTDNAILTDDVFS
jgi:hypothetical protein